MPDSWDDVAAEYNKGKAPSAPSAVAAPEDDWRIFGAKSSDNGPPSAPQRFWDSFKSALPHPIDALNQWLSGPEEYGKASQAFHVLSQIHNASAALPENQGLPVNKWVKHVQPTPEQQALIERGMNAQIGNPVIDNAPGRAFSAPAETASTEASRGNLAGAGGTIMGGYVAPAAVAALPKGLGAAATKAGELISTPGGKEMTVGGATAATSIPLFATGHPVYAGGAAVSGVAAMIDGWLRRQKALAPEIAAHQTAALDAQLRGAPTPSYTPAPALTAEQILNKNVQPTVVPPAVSTPAPERIPGTPEGPWIGPRLQPPLEQPPVATPQVLPSGVSTQRVVGGGGAPAPPATPAVKLSADDVAMMDLLNKMQGRPVTPSVPQPQAPRPMSAYGIGEGVAAKSPAPEVRAQPTAPPPSGPQATPGQHPVYSQPMTPLDSDAISHIAFHPESQTGLLKMTNGRTVQIPMTSEMHNRLLAASADPNASVGAIWNKEIRPGLKTTQNVYAAKEPSAALPETQQPTLQQRLAASPDAMKLRSEIVRRAAGQHLSPAQLEQLGRQTALEMNAGRAAGGNAAGVIPDWVVADVLRGFK